MNIQFVYFDLGNVIAHFSHDKMVAQIAEVVRMDPVAVQDVLFDQGWQEEYESGKCSTDELVDRFDELSGHPVDSREIQLAASDIFRLNVALVPVIGQMLNAGIPLGIISNTCDAHWNWLRNKYSILNSAFREFILSFQVGHCKPEPAIYAEAILRAKCSAQQIYFTDDREEHVRGARDAGMHAELFVSADELAKSLHSLGLGFNY